MPKPIGSIAAARPKNNTLVVDLEHLAECKSPAEIAATLPEGWTLTESIFRQLKLYEFQVEQDDRTVFVIVRKDF